MQFDTIRTPLGELVHQLTYRHRPLDDIVDTAVVFVKEMERMHRLRGSTAPSLHRTKQPTLVIVTLTSDMTDYDKQLLRRLI